MEGSESGTYLDRTGISFIAFAADLAPARLQREENARF